MNTIRVRCVYDSRRQLEFIKIRTVNKKNLTKTVSFGRKLLGRRRSRYNTHSNIIYNMYISRYKKRLRAAPPALYYYYYYYYSAAVQNSSIVTIS